MTLARHAQQTQLTPLGLSKAYDRLTFGRGRAEPRLPLPAGKTGFSRIVVGIDASDASDPALKWARELARAQSADLHLVAVAAPPYAPDLAVGSAAGLWEAEHEEARKRLAQATAFLQRAGVPAKAHVLSGSPPRELARFAEASNADLIIVGSRQRRGLRKFFLGSVAEGVKSRATTSVLVARTPPPAHQILAGADGSALAQHACVVALKLRDLWDADLTLLNVLPPPLFAPAEPVLKYYGRLVDGLELASWQAAKLHYDIQFGDPTTRLLQEAKDRSSDLVVVGSRGLGAARTLVPGSTSTRVAQQATCSVLIIKDSNGQEAMHD